MARSKGLIESIRLLFGRQRDDLIPLPPGYDTQIYNEVMSRISIPEQQTRIIRAAFQLEQLWQYGDLSHIPRVIIMFEETYPHLERMSDLEIYSSKWLTELIAALQLTAKITGNQVQLAEEIERLMHDAELLDMSG